MALCLMALGQAKKPTFTPPDGHWWLNASSEERNGFLTGYFECYSFMLRKEVPSGPQGEGLSEAVTDVYDNGSESAPVASIIQLLFDRWQKEHRYRFVRADPSNEYDGDIWMGGDVKAGYRIAIIEGFLSCQAANGMPAASLSPAQLEARVSRWYGTGKEETLAQEHGNDKLGAVILRAEKEPPQR